MSGADMRDLARAINQGDDIPTGESLRLRRGVITALSTYTATVTIGGVSIPGVPVYKNVTLSTGDTVDILLDGPAPRIVGVVGAVGPQGLVGWEILDSSNRRGYGRYADVSAADIPFSLTVSTTQQWTALHVKNVPSLPGRAMRGRFHFPGAGPVNAGIEWYFYGMVSVNGGAYVATQEIRYAPSGSNAGSPMGEVFFVTGASTTTVSLSLDVRISGGTATLYRWGENNLPFHSHLTLEDLGPA